MPCKLGKTFRTRLAVLGFMLAAATVSTAAQGQPPENRTVSNPADSKSSAAKTEIITGTLLRVDPAKGLIIVARRGPHEPSSLQLSWTETSSTGTGGHTEKSPVSVSQGPGETDYDFRVTSSTVIEVNGAHASLEKLAALTNAKTKVRFTPKHGGDFALEITVSH